MHKRMMHRRVVGGRVVGGRVVGRRIDAPVGQVVIVGWEIEPRLDGHNHALLPIDGHAWCVRVCGSSG